MSYHIRSLLLVTCLSILAVAGCDDSTSKSGAAQAESAKADPGKAVSNNSQLVGMWYRDGEIADPVGLEFSADGKVSAVAISGSNAGEVTLKYDLLEGGRLRLAVPGSESMTQVILANVNGSTLTIKPETGSLLDMGEGTYTRLPAGKTIVARHKERLGEIAKERAALAETLGKFLNQPGLAIVPADGAPGSLHVALNGKADAGNWTGVALLEVAGTTFERQAQIFINRTDPPTLVCTLGAVTGPPGAKPMQPESFTFGATTKDGKLELRDNAAHLLKPDASVNEKLLVSYAAGIKKQRDAMDGFHAKLGTFIYAEEPANGNQRIMKVALLREPGKDLYKVAQVQGSISTLVPASFNFPFQVVLQNGEPELQNAQGQMIRISKAEGGKAGEIEVAMDGFIRPMKVSTLLSADELDARQKELATFVSGLKATPVKIGGVFYQSYTYEHGYVRPVELTLSSPDGKALTGSYGTKVFDVDLPIAGQISPTLLGLVLKFQTAGDAALRGQRWDEGGTFTAELQLVDGKPVLSGKVAPGDGANRLDLAAPNAQATAALRKQLDDHLKAGGAFVWARTGNTGDAREVSKLILKSDDAGKITGTAGFRKSEAPITGAIQTIDGFTVIDLTIPETPPKSVATGTMRLWVVPYGDGFYLSGMGKWSPDNKPRAVCYGQAKLKN